MLLPGVHPGGGVHPAGGVHPGGGIQSGGGCWPSFTQGQESG